MKLRNITLIVETPKESIQKDGVSFVTALALVGIGILTKSDAMQWLGGILFMAGLAVRAGGPGIYRCATIDDARETLGRVEEQQKEKHP